MDIKDKNRLKKLRVEFNEKKKRIKILHDEYETLEGELYNLQIEMHPLECVETAMKHARREDFKTRKNKFLKKWLKAKNLKPGMEVQFSGTKDGHGQRTVRKVFYRRSGTDFHIEAEKPGYITEHMQDKLQAVMIDEEWVYISDLMKES